jgi:hypothetical protein
MRITLEARMRALTVLFAALLLVGGVAVGSSTASATRSSANVGSHRHGRCPLPVFGPGASYRPIVHRGQFGPNVDNPWFPLRPGTTYVYAGVKDGERAIDVFAVSRRTLVVDGVRTRVVNDRLYLNGVLRERTADYYAQDRCGNAWYFGEDTAELDAAGRVVSREGSFRAGVDGAQPGVFMQARPELGRWFRQEWSPDNAEDQFRVIGKNATAAVPYGTFHHALRTEEITALEPGVVDNKLYVRGIGEVSERSVKGPVERLSLVDVLS